MFDRLFLWLAGKILRMRRYSPKAPLPKRLTSWAARRIGKKGRDRWNQERRWLKAVAWANADEARRDAEHAQWMAVHEHLAMVASTPEAMPDEALLAILEADFPWMAQMRDALAVDLATAGIAEALETVDLSDVDPVPAANFLMMEMQHRNVRPRNTSPVH